MCFHNACGFHTGPQYILLCRDVVTLCNALQVIQVTAGRKERVRRTSDRQNPASFFFSPFLLGLLLQEGSGLCSPQSSFPQAPSAAVTGVPHCACRSCFTTVNKQANMGSTPLFTTCRMGLGEGLWLCDPSSQGFNLTCTQKDSEYWTHKQKVEGAN